MNEYFGWFLNHFWLFERIRRRLATIFLPFAPSITDMREWHVEITPPAAAGAFPLPSNKILRVSLHRILIETGIALTLATSSWDPRSWFALYKYGADFAGTTPNLRFYNGVQNKDPRLTAVASEEIATGITCYILREYFNIIHIADTYACIQNNELKYVSPTSKSRPDYFCEDRYRETILAESKGSTGTRSSIARRIYPEGWNQVQNVEPINKNLRGSCSRLVIGTHCCVEK